MTFFKTAAATTSNGKTVYQRGCISACSDTGKITNGVLSGLFCCNLSNCNNITSASNQNTTMTSTTTTTTTIITKSTLSCYKSNLTSEGLGLSTICQANELYCYVNFF